MTTKAMIQITFRVSPHTEQQADEIAEHLSRSSGIAVRRADVLRAALEIGLTRMTAEPKIRKKKLRKPKRVSAA